MILCVGVNLEKKCVKSKIQSFINEQLYNEQQNILFEFSV